MSKEERQRAKLLDKAAEALCENPHLGMKEIAKAIDVSRATLYRYFSTREELLRALALEALRATDEAVEGIFDGLESYESAFKAIIEAVAPLGAKYNFLSREGGLYNDPEVMAGVERQTTETAAMIDAAKEAGEIDNSLPTHWIARHFDTVVWLAWAEYKDGYIARRDVAPIAFRTFWKGIAAEND